MFPIVQTRLMILLIVVVQYRPIRLLTFQAVLQTPEMFSRLFRQEAFGSALLAFRLLALVANSLSILLIAFFNWFVTILGSS